MYLYVCGYVCMYALRRFFPLETLGRTVQVRVLIRCRMVYIYISMHV